MFFTKASAGRGHSPSAPDATNAERVRPDSYLIRSIRSSHHQIHLELKALDNPADYRTGLLIIQMQGQLISSLAAELLARHDKAEAK